ncbi:MAG: hypothetical protein K6G17_02025 [Oscillospiraceae bacterium]|nr:hypothetical protein [Oscillospiraceae bacterium]
MEYLHVIPASTGRTVDFLRCMEERFDLSEHRFLTLISRAGLIKGCPGLLEFPFVETLESRGGPFRRLRNALALRRRLRKADVIVWHGLRSNGGKFAFALMLDPALCRRSVWIEDGVDEESWTQYGSRLKRWIFNCAQRFVRRRIPVLGESFPGNGSYALSCWPDKRVFDTPYPPGAELAALAAERRASGAVPGVEPYLRWKAERDEAAAEAEAAGEEGAIDAAAEKEQALPIEPLRPRERPLVQIGMNAQALNRHNRAFRALAPFAEEPFYFVIPTGFCLPSRRVEAGAAAYKATLRRQSRRLGEKRLFPGRKVSPPAYGAYLRRLNAAVFAGSHAVASDYLLLLLCAGVKLYLPEDSFLYAELRARGVRVHRLEELKGAGAEELVAPDPDEPLPPELAKYLDEDYIADCWRRLFEALRKGGDGK